MHPFESLRLAWRAIRGHKLRSALTALGIVIGIAAVIAFVTLGASLQAGLIGDISPDEGRSLYGWAGDPASQGGPMAGAQPVFTEADLEAVAALEGVEAAYGYAAVPSQAVAFGGEEVALGDGVIAAGPSYVSEGDLREGRSYDAGEREAVLNPAAAGMFAENVSVGDEIEIVALGGLRETATVVGVTETSEGRSPFEGFEASPRLYLPTDPYYTDVAGAVGGEPGGGGDGERDAEDGAQTGTADATDGVRYRAIVVEAPGAGDAAVDRARDAAVDYLESDESDASGLLDGREVVLQTSAELLSQLQDVLDLLRDFIVGVAAISLLVGSIGIANIMLVSVTERTREIGIMKAVGAANREVLGLFLTEAVLLGLVGAVVGTALGLLAGYAAAWYVDLPLVYPVAYVALAIAVGVLVGVLAGLYPAWRAARTDPIDALRYE